MVAGMSVSVLAMVYRHGFVGQGAHIRSAYRPMHTNQTTPRPAPRDRRLRARLLYALLCLVGLALMCRSVSFVIASGGRTAQANCAPAPERDVLFVGAAEANISPLTPVYLGGYGIGPVRRSTGVLQPLTVRALALRSLDNRPEHTL